jgi:hypothetical protein
MAEDTFGEATTRTINKMPADYHAQKHAAIRRRSRRQHSRTSAGRQGRSGAVVIKAGAGEGDAKGPATFGGIAYSGGVAPRHTLSGANLDADYIIDLSGMKPGRGVKANLDHKPTQRVGHVTTINNDGKQVAVEGILSAQTEYRDQVASSAANGYPWESSIEASLGGKEKLAAGKTAVVNGRNVSGPLYIFRRSTLTDLGFVDHGADSGNHITIAASAAGVHHMDEFETFCASLGIADVDALSDEQKSHLTGLHQMKRTAAQIQAAAPSPSPKSLARNALNSPVRKSLPRWAMRR